jgi:ABC-type nitrate/sulfonate/bicarbonate transport system substrate-binding protein
MALPALHAFLAPLLAQRRICRSEFLRQQSAVAAITDKTRGAATRLAGLSRLDDFQALLVRRKSGPRRRADLRERCIGLPASHLDSGAARVDALRGATAVLQSEGLGYHEVDWVALPARDELTLPSAYATEIAALQEGGVDAVYVRGPAGLEAARAADMRVLVDISAERDPWVRINTALLRTVTVSERLLREHAEAVERQSREPALSLPAHMTLDEAALCVLEALKTFMLRWNFVRSDFKIRSWADWQPPARTGSCELLHAGPVIQFI